MPDERPRRAAALRYVEDTEAPEVVAAGAGAAARAIVEAARAAGVPVREDAALAEALGAIDLGQEVPEELWIAVAEVIAWAYALERGGPRSN